MLCMLSYELNKIWRMVLASIGGALRPPDVIEVMKVTTEATYAIVLHVYSSRQ